jgi:hypothetical protein
MPVFLNTLGNSTLGIGICDRCKFKRPLDKLGPDGNLPGLKVCQDKSGCKDDFDPWRLPALQDDRINLPFVRPDEDIAEPTPATEYDPFRITEEDEYRTTGDDDYRTVEEDN